jgi:hypothetical protein
LKYKYRTQGHDIKVLYDSRPPGTTPPGAPPHELGSPSSMPGLMRKLPTVVHYHSRRSASRALERFSAVAIAVSQPFLSRSWAEYGGKLIFWSADGPVLALHDLKPILARCKRTENALLALRSLVRAAAEVTAEATARVLARELAAATTSGAGLAKSVSQG